MKVHPASKALLKVECNDEEIKIRPNCGSFSTLLEELINIKVKKEIKTYEGTAVVKDQHKQTDLRGIPLPWTE